MLCVLSGCENISIGISKWQATAERRRKNRSTYNKKSSCNITFGHRHRQSSPFCLSNNFNSFKICSISHKICIGNVCSVGLGRKQILLYLSVQCTQHRRIRWKMENDLAKRGYSRIDFRTGYLRTEPRLKCLKFYRTECHHFKCVKCVVNKLCDILIT